MSQKSQVESREKGVKDKYDGIQEVRRHKSLAKSKAANAINLRSDRGRSIYQFQSFYSLLDEISRMIFTLAKHLRGIS